MKSLFDYTWQRFTKFLEYKPVNQSNNPIEKTQA